MSADLRLSVVIVNWNTRAYLEACLTSLDEQAIPHQVIVLDNASNDGSAELVRRAFPNVHLIASDKNLGFAAGNNRAARASHGDYLLLLNPDTVVPSGTLQTLVEYADAHPEIGALGPALENPDGSHQRSCWRGYPGLGMALADALYLWKIPWLPFGTSSEYRPEELKQPLVVDHLLGACMLIRRACWQQVGEIDASYFLFLEETDWCYRAQRAGWQLVYYPYAHIVHYGQASVRQAPRKNIPLFYSSYLRFYRARHGQNSPGSFLLKGIIALACVIRMGMWRTRAAQARDTAARELAGAMTLGYRQTLTELGTL